MDFERFLALLQALRDREVEYVLVGAMAMTVHGIVRATRDVDLFVRPAPDNIARLRAALTLVFPEDHSIAQISAEDLAGEYPAIRYNSPDGSLSIDILARLGDAFSFEEIRFEERTYEGIPVRVATPAMLYEMKKDTMRLQDRADAEAIREEFGLEG
ncbi:MAG: nucleotidyl transferase AbiEii/AbiGii toxin family protein [Acidobacteria bacterium]|nr:nucleotidyl transferase AbiEii/AbiGii toxin family protein [Acidobacteriota bacterium]